MAIEGLDSESYNRSFPAQATNDVTPTPGEWRFSSALRSVGAFLFRSPVGLLIAIFTYVAFTRMVALSGKVMHHDESLFAYYGYWLFRGNGYDYQPILHGPVLQYLSAIFFWLFGDDQLTMRLPSLLGGLLMFPVVWLWRRYLGVAGSIAAFLLIALSPSITYYTRFLRNDVPYLTVTMFCAYCVLRALQTSLPRYIWASILSAAIAFSMMESSIFFFCAVVGFMCVIVLADSIAGLFSRRIPPTEFQSRRSLTGWHVLTAVGAALLITLLCGWLFHRMLYNSIHIYAPVLAAAKKLHIPLHARGANLLIAIAFFCAAALFSLFTAANAIHPRGRHGIYHRILHTLWRNRWTVIAALACSVALYEILFTTFFTYTETKSFDHLTRDFTGPERPLTPVQIYQNTWDYWWDQHKLHRIKGPFHYYLPILLLYELPVLALVVWGCIRAVLSRPERWLHIWIFIAVQLAGWLAIYMIVPHGTGADADQTAEEFWKNLDTKFHLSSSFHFILILFYAQILLHLVPLLFAIGRRVEAFLTFWSITALFAYSYAGEKVPWLTVHTTGPLCLLAAIQLRRVWQRWPTYTHRTRTILVTLGAFAVIYQVRNQHYANFVHPASPAERIVYNHTSPDLQEALDIVDRVGRETNYGQQLPMYISGEMAWPLHWYLRHYPNAMPPPSETLDTTTRPLVMVDWTAADNKNLNENYYIRRMKVREWWEPPLLDFSAMLDIYRVFTPNESRRGGLNFSRYQSALAEWRKLWHYIAYREIWIDPLNPDWSNGANEFAFGIRKDLNDTYLTYNWLGLLPKRRDVPQYP